MPTLPINEAALREAMRDRRYWQPGHPERERYGAWVTEGWQALVAARDQGADTVVHVRAYERRGPDGDVIQVQAHTRGAPPRAWEDQPNPEWRAQIAREESDRDGGDHGYGLRGRTNPDALGRYQMTPVALRAARWRDSQNRWSARARAAGVASDADFLANPSAQEAALNDYLRDNESQMRALGVWSRIGGSVEGMRDGPVPITASGLAAAAHREGPETVRRYLAHRDQRLPVPPSVTGRGDLSKFNQVEARLRNFAATPFGGGLSR